MSTVPSAERIRESLENAIIEGRFQPGDRIDPLALEDSFGVSRTPVRDALRALEASGLITVAPKRGTFVAKFDVSELTERFEVMACLEAMCARLTARRATDSDLARIEAAHRACIAAASDGEAGRYYEENRVFHHCIYETSGNRFLAAQAAALHGMLQPYRRLQLGGRGRVMSSVAEHEDIVAAIRAADPEAAAAAMFAHVVIQGDRFNDLAAALRNSRPDLAEGA